MKGQIMDLNILERVRNCFQNNGTSNITQLFLTTQDPIGKLNDLFRR